MTDDPREARKQAQRKLREAKRREPELRALAERLQRLGRENGFSDLVADAMRGSR